MSDKIEAEICGFPIIPSMTLARRGEWCDIPYEVKNHSRDSSIRNYEGTWCYYVTITEQMVSPEVFALLWLEPSGHHARSSGVSYPTYDYMSADFAEVRWHGGITYYEKIGGIDGEPRAVKMGCDFAHAWDEGHYFDYSQVAYEAEQTCAELKQRYNILRRCSWSGKWMTEDQLTEDPHGRLFHKPTKDAFYASKEN